MTNYNTFNAKNYECSNCNSGLNYRNINPGFHGNYSGNAENYKNSFPKTQMSDYINVGKGY